MFLITPYNTMTQKIQDFSFSLNNPLTLTQLRGPILILEFSLVGLAYYLNQITYQQFSLSLLTLIPSFVFNHFFSELQKGPKHNIIPLALDLLVTFFLLFINGGQSNPLYLVLLLHIFIAPFYLEKKEAFAFSLLTIAAMSILPFSPFHFQPLSIEFFPELNFPFLPILVTGLIFWIFSTWLVDEIKTLNQFVQKSIKHKYRADRYHSLGLLTAGICHELGTPLHTLEMRLKQLQKKTNSYPELSPLWEKDFEVLLRNTKKCAQSIRKLNAQAHTDEQYTPAEFCSPKATIEKTIRVFEQDQDQDQDRKLNIQWQPPTAITPAEKEEEYQVQISEILYTRCLLELFKNAYEAGANQVDLKMNHNQKRVILDIKDNGRGMNEEVRRHLGQPFVSTKQRGSGLGLYHLMNTLDYIGGKFKVMPQVDQRPGTWIQIQLPLVTPQKGNSSLGGDYA